MAAHFYRLSLFVLLLSSVQVWAEVQLKEPRLKFTGYKFTSKEGVSGTFKDIRWQYPRQAKTIEEALSQASMEIDSYSIDAGNEARNTNITEALFKNWGAQKVKAKVLAVDSDKALLRTQLQVGELTKEIPLRYRIEDNELVLNGSMDLLALGFKQAFAKLAETCKGLHTGADGVAKTWSEVDLELRAKF